MRRIAPFVWLAYVVLPVEGWGLLHGRPLGVIEAATLAALCWLWWVRRSLPFAIVAVAALIAKVVLGLTLLAPRGFEAQYFANPDFAGPPEAGTEPTSRPSTRTDARLRFGGPGDDDLPLYFLNDSSRFNFYLPNQPERATLPVSVKWEGWLRVARSGPQRFYVRTAGARVGLAVGDGFSAEIPSSTTDWVVYPSLKAGFERIRISLSIPSGGARRFEAGRTIAGRSVPFESADVFLRPVSTTALAADSVVRAISTAFDLLVCAWLAVQVWREVGGSLQRLVTSPGPADALRIAWVAAGLDALLFVGPLPRKMVTLGGGEDWLSYETMARDIGLHGLWMTGGAALGHGSAFYYQPLYSYFLAATHWLFGDDLYGVCFVQRGLVAGTAIALWRTTASLFGERVGAGGLLAATVVVYTKVAPWSGVLLSELLFVPFICGWALLLVRLAKSEEPSLRSAAGAGAVGGLATLTRSTLTLAWLLELPLVALSLVRTKRAGRIAGVLGAVLLAVTLLATFRNWVVARQIVFVSSSGSNNLFFGNRPPPSLVVPAARKAAYERFGVEPNAQLVIEYARQSPGAFFEGWRQKAAYALGSFTTLVPGEGRSLFYMGVSAVALFGVVLLAARPSWLRGAGPAALIPLSLALAHLAPLVIITVYGERLLLPFYALLVPYVGIMAFGAHQLLWRLIGPRMGLLACLSLAGMAASRYLGGLPEIALPVTAMAVLVWGVSVFGAPRLPRAAAAFSGVVVIGLCVWAVARRTVEAEAQARLGLLIVLSALCLSTVARGLWRRGQR